MSEIIVPKPEPTPQLPPLTLADVAQVVGAVRRKKQLLEQTIATPQRDAELAGVKAFISRFFQEREDEIVGGLFALLSEYQPLVDALSGIFWRVGANVESRKEARK